MNAPDARQHELFEELAAGHALAALEPEDEQLFLAHLPTCAQCQAALMEHLDTLGHLAYATERATPPPALLAGIRAGIDASGRASTVVPPSRLETARRRRLSARWGAAVVGAAAALALVGSLVVSQQDLQRTERDNAALTRAVSRLLSPEARSVPLTGAGGAKAVAVLQGNNLSLVLSGVHANDSDTIYVLWEQSREGQVRAVKAFDVRKDGVTVVNDLRLSSGDLAALMVTHEKGRTAPTRSTQPAVVTGEAA